MYVFNHKYILLSPLRHLWDIGYKQLGATLAVTEPQIFLHSGQGGGP